MAPSSDPAAKVPGLPAAVAFEQRLETNRLCKRIADHLAWLVVWRIVLVTPIGFAR